MRRMMISARWRAARCLAAGALAIYLLAVAGNLRAADAAKVDQLFAQWDRVDSPGAAVVVLPKTRANRQGEEGKRENRKEKG
jgi:hypothetical protein